MALLTELVKAIATVEGIEESFVTGVARYLREAGLISQAGRGRGAAKMTYADATALLIGVNATSMAKDAENVVSAFRSLTRTSESNIKSGNISISSSIPLNASFSSALERLLMMATPKAGDPFHFNELQQQMNSSSEWQGVPTYDEVVEITDRTSLIEVEFERPIAKASIWHLARESGHSDLNEYRRGYVVKDKLIFECARSDIQLHRSDRRDTSSFTNKTIFAVVAALLK
ncbi:MULTISPECIES: hypothetical protein [Hyphomicrobiales]|uniref:hypothetical protein n=1 Tax=Hyphomicrobiales TaxID=356 RepID=UPI001BCEF059|nr:MULTISPECIES: hypothetical protein [Hyphomicrobiales]CAH1662716.1 conserved hypothetical protein [Hyphomicrobiales bacterium]MBS7741471.1 hypothetical protein [Chelatococcus sp. HY11]MBX3491218.1 hypothetical protein [Parvibaculum sp.]MBX3544509.1 hypothetical protein [Chelatococcus sp.]MCO5078968.1 hypothetical protein [Chelatococcus sp.]